MQFSGRDAIEPRSGTGHERFDDCDEVRICAISFF
jgi:hypothetical protein